MRKPQPKKHAECDHCHRVKPLLMPFGWIPGFPFVMWELLCWRCRCSVQLSRHSQWYGVPADVERWSHDPNDWKRYEQFLKANP